MNLKCLPAVGNFVTVDCGEPAPLIFSELLRRGVIVRTLGEYDMPNHLRVTVGTATEIERCIEAFEEVRVGC